MIFFQGKAIAAAILFIFLGAGSSFLFNSADENHLPAPADNSIKEFIPESENSSHLDNTQNQTSKTLPSQHAAVTTSTDTNTQTHSNLPTINTTTDSMTHWHEPGAHDGLNPHEHGDKPPAWADTWSNEKFGHPVIWGGDEATPKENEMKHQAYKGYSMTASGVELYVRFHAQSNPHGRSGPLHSYEVYAKDQTGGISFWQGWMFFGYPEVRSQRMTRAGEFGGYDETYDITWPGRDSFIISGSDHDDWDDYKRCEQWYGTANGFISWDIGLTICAATTFYSLDEHKGDIMNMATWEKTGDLGLQRRLEVSHYGPNNPIAQNNLDIPIGEWYCVKKIPNENRATGEIPKWDYTGAVADQNSCDNGWLPQYVAPTFPAAGVYFKTGNTEDKLFPGKNIVSLPN